MIDRKNCCPKCGSNLIAREGIFVFCLTCDWACQKKRKDDDEITDIHKLKSDWH